MRLEVLTEVVDRHCVYALVILHAERASNIEDSRSPLNLALVLDRSSSMRGPRLNQAVHAAAEVANRLQPQDRLTIVQFDSAADVVFGPSSMDKSGRDRAFRALANTQAGAGTNLSAGIRRAADALRGTFVRGAVTRMLLLTDGQPSVGITDAGKLGLLVSEQAEDGITLSAMGLGETFDDALLSDLAQRGGGGFYFLSRPSDIAAAFGHEISGVFAIAAKDARLTILPRAHVASAEVLNRMACRAVGDGIEIRVGDVAEGIPRQILIRFELSDSPDSSTCATLKLTHNRGDGSSGDPHIAAVDLSSTDGDGCRAVMLERLRLSSAIAVDLAWARRLSDDRDTTLAAVSEIRRDINRAIVDNAADCDALKALVRDLDTAEHIVLDRAQRQATAGRDLRERSHSVLMGISKVSALPRDDD